MNIPNASPALYNADLAPATERNWGAFSIFNVWTSDVHSLWGYYLAASLFVLGVFLGSALWWLLLSAGVGLLRHRLDQAGLRWVNRLSGTVIAAFGMYALSGLV